MKPSAGDPQTAEIAATLEVIEATLAGEPVDPAGAEVAELVLLLADERPKPADKFARELDRRVEDRFGTASKATAKARTRRNRAWVLAPAGALAALAAIVALIASAPGGTGSSASSGAAVSSMSNARPTHAAPQALRQAGGSAPSSSPGVAASPGLHPPSNGRKLIQSSQLTLGARPARIETVAQEALEVVGAHNGFVDSATVNAAHGSSGFANLHLTVPSATLPQTMTLLSRLPYSTVVSRTDNVEDVTLRSRAPSVTTKRHGYTRSNTGSPSARSRSTSARTPPPPPRATADTAADSRSAAPPTTHSGPSP